MINHAVAAALITACAGCSASSRLSVDLRVPPTDRPFDGVDAVTLSAFLASGEIVALRRQPIDAARLSIDPLPAGHRYTLAVEAFHGNDLLARGRSCPFNVEAARLPTRVSVLFSSIGRFSRASDAVLGRRGAAVVRSGERVLLAGSGIDEMPTTSVASYDHGLGELSPGSPLGTARAGARGASLPDGSALIVGGATLDSAPAAERYDPNTDRFQALAAPIPPRLVDETVTLLGDGSVLVAGGGEAAGLGRAQAFLVSGLPPVLVVRPTQAMLRPRRGHSATLIGRDRFSTVAIVGGVEGSEAVDLIELFDPSAAGGPRFVEVTVRLGQARAWHTATLLPSGRILIIGGLGAMGPVAVAELFDPVNQSVRRAGRLNTPRHHHGAALLADGRVLLAGGLDAAGRALTSVEIFDPSLGSDGDFVVTEPMLGPAGSLQIAPLCDGTLLMMGGDFPEIYQPLR